MSESRHDMSSIKWKVRLDTESRLPPPGPSTSRLWHLLSLGFSITFTCTTQWHQGDNFRF